MADSMKSGGRMSINKQDRFDEVAQTGQI